MSETALEVDEPEVEQTDEPEVEQTDEPEVEQTDEPEVEQTEALAPRVTEQQWEKRWRAADRLAANHRRALDRIFEEDAAELVTCPFCPDNLPGFVFPFQLEDEHRVAMLQAVGIGELPEMLTDPEAELCAVCNGWGETLTGSPIPEQRKKMCPCCNKKGWTNAQERNIWKGTQAQLDAAANVVETPPAVVLAPSGLPTFDTWNRPVGHEFYGRDPQFMTGDEKMRDWPGVN